MSNATGTCPMCLKATPLEMSHIIPAFVFRWLKDTAALPFIRSGENPNKRLQDGWKKPWLCGACEDHIGTFETAFAKELFPLIVAEKPAPYPYGPWLARLVASVTWRALQRYAERSPSLDFVAEDQKPLVPETLEQWRAFVHGEVDSPGIHELHIIPMSALAGYDLGTELAPNFNRYLLRTVEMHVAGNPSQTFVYVKLGPAIALGFIEPPLPDTWVGTQVSLGEGQVGGKMIVPEEFLHYLIGRAENVRESMLKRSDKQKEKIRTDMLANLDRAAASETFRAVQADVEMFGLDQVFPNLGRLGPDSDRVKRPDSS